MCRIPQGQHGAKRCQYSRIPNMMMSQIEIMEKGRRLVGLIQTSTMAWTQSFQLPVQCSDCQAPYIEPQVQFMVGPPDQSIDGTGIAVQPAPHALICSAQYAIDHPVHLAQCPMVEALAGVALLVVREETSILILFAWEIMAEATVLILHKDMWNLSTGGQISPFLVGHN